MKTPKNIVAMTCAVTLSGCSVFSYPDGPVLTSEKRPIPLNDAIIAAEKLERSYLDAAGEQLMVDKLTKLSFVASAGTAIAGALYGAHRDLVTGAAFAGGTIYAGSLLFGSPNQRLVYRTGAQALSCAVTAVSPLAVVDDTKLQAAYDNISAIAADFDAKVIDLENAMDGVTRPALSTATYPAYDTKMQALVLAIAQAASDVDAAIADSTGGADPAARTSIRNANKALADYLLAALNAKSKSDTILNTTAYAALDTAKMALEGLKKAAGYAAWMDAQINDGLAAVKALRDLQVQADTLAAKSTKSVIDANTAVYRARLDLEGWRTLPYRMEEDRTRANKILSDLKDAGSKLYSATKNIHIKVVGELEQFEPSRAAILQAFSSVTGAALTNASTITADRGALFGDGSKDMPSPSGNQQSTLNPAAAVGAAPVGAGAPPSPGGAPVAAQADTPANRAALQQRIDSVFTMANMPDKNGLQQEIRGSVNLINQIVTAIEGRDGLQSRHSEMRSIAGKIRVAHSTIKDQVTVIKNVDLSTIQSTCMTMINPGVKPLKTNTNQIQVDASATQYLYVSGGRGDYFAQYDQPTTHLEIKPGYDPQNGKFRFEIIPITSGFTTGKTYKMTVLDEDDRKAEVTITTK